MKTVLVTGSQGFIGSYLCEHLLAKGYRVVGVDDYSKYGKIVRAHDFHPEFTLYEMTIGRRENPFTYVVANEHPDYIIAGAAMIGGIAYFHKYAYDLLARNECTIADTFDAAIDAWQSGSLKRIVVISSSMVFENSAMFPTPECDVKYAPPPDSTYGFQKLATEYFAKGAYEQYKLPYTIVRPFNCVGVGEEEAIDPTARTEGNDKLQLSHVVPDLVMKVLQGQDPLEILGNGSQVRCYTNGKDVARGIVLAMESEEAGYRDFNISTPTPTTVLELASKIWSKLRKEPLHYKCVDPFLYDVQKRIPDTSRARNFLGFHATITLDQSLDEVIAWLKKKF